MIIIIKCWNFYNVFNIECYRTCLTCAGLFENDCTACLNNRVMTLDNKCTCQTGYSDLNRLDECFRNINFKKALLINKKSYFNGML